MDLRTYHQLLFAWHGRKFFRFRRHLSPAELAYLETCFALARGFQETSESGYAHFSYYTYSHRVRGQEVNSSRLAYGSVVHPEAAWEAAGPVLRERGLALEPLGRFYGLGWDILEGQFKVYWRVPRVASLPPELLALTRGQELAAHRPEGLVSYTFTENVLSESKVYLYPLATPGEARMLTSGRGLVAQQDVQPGSSWDLNPAGQAIVALYEERGEPLDTIAYQDRENFTLYFP